MFLEGLITYMINRNSINAISLSKDNEAARRRCRKRIVHTLRKPTTQPTKLAKESELVLAPFFDKSYWYRTNRCNFAVWGYPQCAARRNAVSNCSLRAKAKQCPEFIPAFIFRMCIAQNRRKAETGKRFCR